MPLGTFDKLEEDGTIRDDYRIHYMAEHIKAMYHAVPLDGVDLMGYTCWGCIDLVSNSSNQMTNTAWSMWIAMTTATAPTAASAKSPSTGTKTSLSPTVPNCNCHSLTFI